ncbi:hypothetical protein MCETRE41_00016 [Candidatus Methylopumilus universalis]
MEATQNILQIYDRNVYAVNNVHETLKKPLLRVALVFLKSKISDRLSLRAFSS